MEMCHSTAKKNDYSASWFPLPRVILKKEYLHGNNEKREIHLPRVLRQLVITHTAKGRISTDWKVPTIVSDCPAVRQYETGVIYSAYSRFEGKTLAPYSADSYCLHCRRSVKKQLCPSH